MIEFLGLHEFLIQHDTVCLTAFFYYFQELLVAYVRAVALANGLLLSDIDARLSVQQLGCDLRRTLSHLEFWVRSSRPRCSLCAHRVNTIPEGRCVEIRPSDGLFVFLTRFKLLATSALPVSLPSLPNLKSKPEPEPKPKFTSECPATRVHVWPPRSLQLALGYKHSSDSLLLSRVLGAVCAPSCSGAGEESRESSRLQSRRTSASLRQFAAFSDLVARGLLSTEDLPQLLERPSTGSGSGSGSGSSSSVSISAQETKSNSDSNAITVCQTEQSDQKSEAEPKSAAEPEPERGSSEGERRAGEDEEAQWEKEMRALLDDSERERTHIEELRAAERDLCARLSGGGTLCAWLAQSRARRLDYLPYVRALLAAERRSNPNISADLMASCSPSASASRAESPEVISLLDSPLNTSTSRLTRSSRYISKNTYKYNVFFTFSNENARD